jgi:hypothetical protein
MAFLGVAFLALASARMALASFAAAFSMPAFLWENFVPNGWSSSDDSRVAVSLMEEGSFAPFFLAIGSSSLSGSTFWCFDFGRLACIGQPTAVCGNSGEGKPPYQGCTVVTVRLFLVLDRLANRAPGLALSGAVGRRVDIHAVADGAVTD